MVAQTVKHLPTMQETQFQSLGWEDLLEKEMATHSSILAWKIPWTEEPGRLQSMGLQRVGYNGATSHSHSLTHTHSLCLSCGMWTLSCGMWDLVPRPGMEPGSPALGAWSLSHRTNREGPKAYYFLMSRRFELVLHWRIFTNSHYAHLKSSNSLVVRKM